MKAKRICLVYNTGKYLYCFRCEFIQQLIKNGWSVYALFPDDGFAKKIESLGVICRNLDIGGYEINPISQILLYFRFRRILRDINPEKIISFTIKPVIFSSILSKQLGIQSYCVVTGLGRIYINNDIKTKIVRFITNRLYKRYLDNNEYVFFQNTSDKALFLDYGCLPSEKAIITNGSGVNLDQFPRKSFLRPVEKIIFMMAGRLDSTKGLNEYIQAAGIITEQYRSGVCEFWLLGTIHHAPKIKKELESENNAYKIRYFGFREDLSCYYKNASVFVLPSYREGTSRSILEAMSSGMPIIATDVPGCREPVKDKENGFLVPAKEITKLSKAMGFFIDNPDQVYIMGKRSRQIVEQNYNVHSVNSVILEKTLGKSYT